jgi:hypothetical protein
LIAAGAMMANTTNAIAAVTSTERPVENLLAAQSVRKQKDAGAAKVVRIECDFVTCSQ